jgi:hypothetical protein
MAKSKPPPRELTAEDRRCLEKLRSWTRCVDDLLELLGDQPVVIGSRATQARELFVGLKENLRVEAKRLATLRRVGQLQGFEESDYAPAIEQALAEFTVKTNSAPGPAWSSDLHNTHITLSAPLSWLEDQE